MSPVLPQSVSKNIPDVFAQDFPYGIGFWDVDANIADLANSNFLTVEEKEGVFFLNARELWKKNLKKT